MVVNNHYAALLLLLLLMLIAENTAVPDHDTCQACNCRLNNVEILEHLVEEKINNVLAKLPGNLSSCD